MKSDNKRPEIKLKNRSIQASYDELPYFYHVSEGSHPYTMSMIGRLHGLNTPEPNDCRVLELACGRGVNIISIANTLPNSKCVGIELSAQHVKGAEELSKSLGLNNLLLQQQDIMDISDDIGEFDYIIVNGTFSWVPAEVQNKILKICANHLSDDGLAMLHYATKPGAEIQKTIGDMLNYHLKKDSSTKDRFDDAMDFAAFFVKHSPEKNIYARYLEQIQQGSIAYKHNFYHETLGEASQAFYFEEFFAKAEQSGLNYIDDSVFGYYAGISDVARAELELIPDTIRREQYLDFVLNRASRSSILCHANRKVRQLVKPQRCADLYFASSAKLIIDEKQENLNDNQFDSNENNPANTLAKQRYQLPNKRELSFSTPLLSACIQVLGDIWPKNILLKDLVIKVRELLIENNIGVSEDGVIEQQYVAKELLTLARKQVCEISPIPNRCATEVSEKPEANPLSRLLAELRGQQTTVVNTKLQNINLDSFTMYVLELLNGERTRDQILTELLKKHESGVMTISLDDEGVEDKDTVIKILERALDEKLNILLRSSLLVD